MKEEDATDATLGTMAREVHKIAQAERPLAKYGPTLLAFLPVILGLFVIWGDFQTLQSAFAETQDEVKELETEKEEVAEKLVEIETKQETIKEDVEEIKEEVRATNDKLDEILRRLPRE